MRTDELLVMRLADMHRIHPNQDNSHVCSRCGHIVGIYPSGQDMIKIHPEVRIVCSVCADVSIDLHDPTPQIIQEMRDSKLKE